MSCWFWNIDKAEHKYFNDELEKHRLRQGWGYDDKLDLRKLNGKVASKIPLDEAEQGAWSRCWYMLAEIKVGDLVVVKNVPKHDRFTIVKVTGPYDFTNTTQGDYEHVLPVETVGVYHKQSAVVPATLVNALNRAQSPIIRTIKHHQAVCDLASKAADTTPEVKVKPERFKEKVARWQKSLLPHLKDALQKDLSHNETERLVLEMLKRDRDGKDVEWIAGPSERGADILCSVQIGYGITYKLAVQVKMHPGQDNDQTGIEQLEQAFTAHGVQAGILVTTADTLGPDLTKRIKESKYNIQVIYGEDLYGRLLEWMADPSLDLTD
jgi:predicted Mrr-cat superfamily restriction endonuclease